MLPAFVDSFWYKDSAYSLLMLSDGIQVRNWEGKKKKLNYCNVKLTPDNSNPCQLKPCTNSNQNQAPGIFSEHTVQEEGFPVQITFSLL